MTVLVLFAGLVVLIIGAEALVRGASSLAAALGVTPLVIGLTVVAFGTSSPELAVSVGSAFSGQADIALGNVIGSNIFNVLFVLGLSALIIPLVVSEQLVRVDVPLMLALSILVLILSLDGLLSRIDGGLLGICLCAYLAFLFLQNRAESEAEPTVPVPGPDDASSPRIRLAKNAGLIAAGLALLVMGSRWLVAAAVSLADQLGISELVVGLTIVAAGTSLPEVVTSIIAAVRGERDIAVGNVVGSNIFNLAGVLGITGLVAPAGIEVSTAVVGFDLPVMIAVALACMPLFFTGSLISRQEGAVLLAYYVAYTCYLVLAASHHDALPEFSAVMLYFVIPLTAITLFLIAWRELRRGGR